MQPCKNSCNTRQVWTFCMTYYFYFRLTKHNIYINIFFCFLF